MASNKSIVLQHGAQRVLLRCPESYNAASLLASKEFRINMLKTLAFYVDMAALEPGSALGQVQLSPSTWGLLLETAGTAVVDVRIKDQHADGAPDTGSSTLSYNQQLRIKACSLSGDHEFHFVTPSRAKVRKLLGSLSDHLGGKEDTVFLSFHGRPLPPDQTLEELGIADGDILDYGTLPSPFHIAKHPQAMAIKRGNEDGVKAVGRALP
ncbi:hypothetical protein AURDEDRAFT_162399 [Auricularia subglabra TFB-10046 SS5]|nr:hypothetical protein AURDEDRAFT_162399 [Auricularia subglabra TFB-10046 SS5]